jgi:hypothetical protein
LKRSGNLIKNKDRGDNMFPKRMLWGDKIFWSITLWILIGLFWLRFLEGLFPVWVSNFISIPIIIYIIRLEDPVKLRKKEKIKMLNKIHIDIDIKNNK